MTIDKLHIIKNPEYAGGYQMGGPLGISFNLLQRPTRWHQFWMKVCLGWVWVDVE